ncbi:MAG: NifU family protein [Candidatus Hecatellales archaeon]|nr:MAG: NifU family protein [Candidatus Hecatellales archaeon]
MLEKVKRVIDEQIKPALEAEGGFIELVEVKDDGRVFVRFGGACAGCPMSQFTLKNFIEAVIKESVPEVKEVISVP